jgi:hypothetical protein
MATLASSAFSLPNHLASGIWDGVRTTATIPILSGESPQLFGTTQYMKFTAKPKAEFVAEGAAKGQSQPAVTTVNAVPRKAQVTVRYNEEVQWADDDYQLGVLADFSTALQDALSRALDLGVYHGMNPKDGTALSGAPTKVYDTTNSVEVATATASADLLSAAGLVIADGYTPNGIAFNPDFAFKLATEKDADGRLIQPELGLGVGLTTWAGLNAAVSTTVSGTAEGDVTGGIYDTNPNIKAFVGDFTAIKWGVQKDIPVEVIRYGDPDGDGDLKRENAIALRGEVVYGWAIMDVNAFATIKDAA